MLGFLSFTVVLSLSYYLLAKFADYQFKQQAKQDNHNFWSITQ